MKVIAIEGSGMTASVAVSDEEKLIAEFTVDHKKTHSETLMVMLDEVCKSAELNPSEVDAVAISMGPGSFTGLRIGSATAKGLAEAWKCPVVEVPTLAAMAYGLYGNEDLIVPILDARRKQVYTGAYTFEISDDGEYVFENVLEDRAIDLKEWIEELKSLDKHVVFLGDGVPVMKDIIEGSEGLSYSFAPSGFNRQKASNVAAYGLKLLKEGKTVEAKDHKPEYLRKSQAEREREERNG